MIGKSGIGTYISGIIPYLIQQNNQCLLIGRSEDLSEYSHKHQVKILHCDIPVFSLQEFFAFPSALRKEINTYDLYYSPYCNIPNGIHIPVYSTIHDIVFLDIKGLTSPAGTIIRKWYYKQACRRSSTIFTVSEFSKGRIQKKLHCKKNIVVTYTAVAQWCSNISTTTNKPPKKDYLLFVGNIKKHKGLHTLLPAFLSAKKKGLSAKLIIVGSADNFRTGDSEIQQKLAGIPDDSVQFTGYLTDEALKNLYMQSKLLVQPSEYEGFGLPPLEALSSGTHTLISDIPVFKEVYAKMPVTYFKTGNTEDLCNKLLETYKESAKPFTVPELYSFKRTANIIQKTFSDRQA